MSVRSLTRVWDASQHSGTELLMLLAIADFADDDGRAYPAVARLARKCRTTPRHANRLLASLRDSGELEIRLNAGEHGQNRYRILFEKMAAPLTATSALTNSPPLTATSGTPDKDVPEPLTCMSDKPSLNRQEPSCRQPARKSALKVPGCPFAEVVAAYHEILPELPRVRILDSNDRKAKTADFWAWVFKSRKTDGTVRATDAESAMEWIRAYFERARANDFLMGRMERQGPHKDWRADFDYLLTERGRKQVIEKTEGA